MLIEADIRRAARNLIRAIMHVAGRRKDGYLEVAEPLNKPRAGDTSSENSPGAFSFDTQGLGWDEGFWI